jgi:class 3 adenylate cyclase
VPAGEERKLVTVVFADLVGSTELAGRSDPERVRAHLERF